MSPPDMSETCQTLYGSGLEGPQEVPSRKSARRTFVGLVPLEVTCPLEIWTANASVSTSRCYVSTSGSPFWFSPYVHG